MKNLFAVCYECPPEVTPTSIRAGKLLRKLQTQWQITALAKDPSANLGAEAQVNWAQEWYPKLLIDAIDKIRLSKFIPWFIPFWPERTFFWLFPAILRGIKSIAQRECSVILVFMMPYGAGLIGIVLKWLTGIPLVLNFDDSPTCTDMRVSFPSWFHYKMTAWMEDFYIRQSDKVIYVSQWNLERVQSRQPKEHQSKFHLVRFGADEIALFDQQPRETDSFEIVYTGGMTGWFELCPDEEKTSIVKTIYRKWMELGRYRVLEKDIRSSSPFFIGQAVQNLLQNHPDWQGKVRIKIYGNRYPENIVNKVLEHYDLTEIVSVFPPVQHSEAIELISRSDLLFMTLPARLDNSSGGRISAKTYEYLMTNRPILAAIPQGENWNYLEKKPGTWLVSPTDVSGMAKVLEERISAKFAGEENTFDRAQLRPELSYETRAKELDFVLQSAVKEWGSGDEH